MRILFFLFLASFFQLNAPPTQIRPPARRLGTFNASLFRYNDDKSTPATRQALNTISGKNLAQREEEIKKREKEEADAAKAVARRDKLAAKNDEREASDLPSVLNKNNNLENLNSPSVNKTDRRKRIEQNVDLPSTANIIIKEIDAKIKKLDSLPEYGAFQQLSESNMPNQEKARQLEVLQRKVEQADLQKNLLNNARANFDRLKKNLDKVQLEIDSRRIVGGNLTSLQQQRDVARTELANALKDFDIKSILAGTQGSRVDRSFDNLDNQIQQPISLPDNKPVNLSLPPITLDRRGSSAFEDEDTIFDEIRTPKNSSTITDTPQPDQDEFEN